MVSHRPGHHRAFRPGLDSWAALCRPASFDALLSEADPTPGYDLCAYLANRAALAYDDDHHRRQVIKAEGGLDAQTLSRWTDSAYAYRRGEVAVAIVVMNFFDGKAHGAAGYCRAFQAGYRRPSGWPPSDLQ